MAHAQREPYITWPGASRHFFNCCQHGCFQRTAEKHQAGTPFIAVLSDIPAAAIESTPPLEVAAGPLTLTFGLSTRLAVAATTARQAGAVLGAPAMAGAIGSSSCCRCPACCIAVVMAGPAICAGAALSVAHVLSRCAAAEGAHWALAPTPSLLTPTVGPPPKGLLPVALLVLSPSKTVELIPNCWLCWHVMCAVFQSTGTQPGGQLCALISTQSQPTQRWLLNAAPSDTTRWYVSTDLQGMR